MKKILCLTVALALGMSAMAQNYFAPGTTWTYTTFLDWWPFDNMIETYQLVEAVNQDGEECLLEQIHVRTPSLNESDSDGYPQIKEYDTTGSYIKVEGDKVFAYSSKSQKSDWRLVYDFSLEQGQGCFLHTEIHKAGMTDDKVFHEDYERDCFFKFEEMVHLDEYQMDFMRINVYESESESTDASNAIWTEYWLRGVGAVNYFTASPVYFLPKGEWAGGNYTEVCCVTAENGDIIVKNSNWSGIDGISAETDGSIPIYFDLSGRQIEHPGHGIFIEKKGSHVRKIAK